ncbi:SDR family oxidoreductase [Halogeometricum luteum]|uniref:SDR family oxidoreductase n=1 Tax=Halogeometricum luteum TaxID=2950537 RepID=A0ABU2G1T3_9EURY|nr:SDR family oxidoreductase [Halogeometricum sp. S3BR5-2]MDS0294746.1 SDR family oxidoreductase [Halogeometricum sp. S3BR5-2]
MIVVTGATGTVGEPTVESLLARGADVRAAVRNPSAASVPAGTETVEFDFERPETWGRAFDGATGLFLLRPPTTTRVSRRLLPAADAAVRCGVDRVTFLSVLGAERNPLLPHRRVERHLETDDTDAGAGATHAFLRASYFMQNLAEVHAPDVRERGELFVPAGDGATSLVDARDVGAVAAATLTEPGHANVAYDLTGPEAVTYEEVAAVLSDVLGRPVEYVDPSARAFARRMRRRGHDWGFVVAMLGIYATARFGLAGRVEPDASAVLGRPPRDVATFAADYADAWR